MKDVYPFFLTFGGIQTASDTVSNICASWVSFPFSSTYPFMIVGLIPIRGGDFEHVERSQCIPTDELFRGVGIVY